MNILAKTRKPTKQPSLSKTIFFAFLFLLLGSILGVSAKLFDLNTQNLGNIFSQMSIWIAFSVLIAIYSKSPLYASLNVFAFFIGMLSAYYLMADITNSVYSFAFISGWSFIALLSPAFAFLTWYSIGKGWLAKSISVAILSVMLLSAIVLFDRIRIADIVVAAFTAFILFKPRKKSLS